MFKKGQAAMEFLTTYGWAILVVLAAIAALAYFGVLSPDKFLPSKCIISPGIACTGYKVESAQTTLVLTNAIGKDLTVTNIAVGACTKAFSQSFDNGDKANFVLTGCSNGDVKAKFSGDITINYEEKDTLLNKTTYGSMVTRVE
ncbi:MAG: hypothetical protein Q7J54_00515 [Candidatus Woesearchaeota archaeon]|nr:hypothetical protein [Candidatus Woesearchaeota archaeon]